LAENCTSEVKAFCSEVAPGEQKVLECLVNQLKLEKAGKAPKGENAGCRLCCKVVEAPAEKRTGETYTFGRENEMVLSYLKYNEEVCKVNEEGARHPIETRDGTLIARNSWSIQRSE